MINIENLSKTLENIKKYGPEHSDMTYFLVSGGQDTSLRSAPELDISESGVTACIIGHSALVMASEGLEIVSSSDISDWLGFDTSNNDEFNFFLNLSIGLLWTYLGKHGIKAYEISKNTNDYEAMVFLIEKIIENDGDISKFRN
jgi:hypothetical protein